MSVVETEVGVLGRSHRRRGQTIPLFHPSHRSGSRTTLVLIGHSTSLRTSNTIPLKPRTILNFNRSNDSTETILYEEGPSTLVPRTRLIREED